MPSDLDPKKETVRHSKGQKKKNSEVYPTAFFFFFPRHGFFDIFRFMLFSRKIRIFRVWFLYEKRFPVKNYPNNMKLSKIFEKKKKPFFEVELATSF